MDGNGQHLRLIREVKIKNWWAIKLKYRFYCLLFDASIGSSKKLPRSKFGQWFFFCVVSYFECKFRKLSRQMFGSVA